MKYLDRSFSVGGHTSEYSDGWERIFGKKRLEFVASTIPCSSCGIDCTLTHSPDLNLNELAAKFVCAGCSQGS